MAQSTRARAKGGAKATIDHDEIRRWVEERGGKPAVVKRTANGRQPGIRRIDFPGFSGEQSLEELEWDQWFERFDSANLGFLYQDETGSGKPSRFNKLVARESMQAGNGKSSSRRSSGARGGARAASAKRGNRRAAAARRAPRAPRRAARRRRSAERAARPVAGPETVARKVVRSRAASKPVTTLGRSSGTREEAAAPNAGRPGVVRAFARRGPLNFAVGYRLPNSAGRFRKRKGGHPC